jgi:hypothetical protein
MRSPIPLALAFAALLSPARAAADEQCGTCHPNIRTERARSVHAAEFGCTGCHGGDPDALEVERAHAPAKGYIGTPSRRDIPALCARCHADPTRMKPTGQSTDQYAQYQTSGHGRRLAAGDLRAAVCTDCHGTHGIQRVREPTSPVARQNVSTTCGRCHSDATLMQAYNLPADQEEKFRRSIHSAALLEEEHPTAPTCSTCHGAHGAVAPAVGTVAEICGHCHTRSREHFRQGAHGQAAKGGKMAECVSCHAYHDTTVPDHTLFDTACVACHPSGSPPLAIAEQLKTVLRQAEDAVTTTADELHAATTIAPTMSRYHPRLQQGRAFLMEALPVQHSLSVERVSDLTRTARSIGDEVRAAVHGVKEEARLRYLWLALGWVFIALAATLLHLYRREEQRARRT